MPGSWIVEEIFFHVGILPYNFRIPFSIVIFLVGLGLHCVWIRGWDYDNWDDHISSTTNFQCVLIWHYWCDAKVQTCIVHYLDLSTYGDHIFVLKIVWNPIMCGRKMIMFLVSVIVPIEIRFFPKVDTYKIFVMFISPESVFTVEVPTPQMLWFSPPLVLMFFSALLSPTWLSFSLEPMTWTIVPLSMYQGWWDLM